MDNIKIKEEYIDVLKKIQEEYNTITVMFGSIAVQELMIKEQKDKYTKVFQDYRKQEDDIVSKIRKEYGEGQINFETGELIKI